MEFRQNTVDKKVFDTIQQEYFLPSNFSEEDIVIDIGCHIGSFSYICAKKNVGKILSFEPFRENYELAKKNLSEFSNVEVFHKAVWRSDKKENVFYTYSKEIDNTGGGHCIFKDPVIQRGAKHDKNHVIEEIETVSLDEIVSEHKIRLLKIDCEFSEYAILLTSKSLGNIQEIVGEYHQMTGKNGWHVPDSMKFLGRNKLTIHDIKDCLNTFGFTVSVKSTNDTIGTFHAFKENKKYKFLHL